MIQVTIDCAEIKDRAAFHHLFAVRLHLPKWYGNNLDALYDCLTDLHQKTTLNLIHVQDLINSLDSYGRAAINMIEQAERENSEYLTVNMI